MAVIKQRSLILNVCLVFMIIMSCNSVGAKRIKLLPDSFLLSYQKLVVGGREAVRGEFPFQVSLQKTGSGHTCGGTILDPYTILTAAHCFDDRHLNVNYEVVAGNNTLKGPHERVQKRQIDRIFIHPKYSQEDNGIAAINDIAIVRVQVPFIFNHHVNAAKLPEADVYPEGDVQVCGWGSTSKSPFSSLPEVLQVVDLALLPQVECEAYVLERQHLKSGAWVKSLLCTNPLSGLVTPWTGDSGGPLLQDGVVVGVVSTGDEDTPLAIYTRVSAFLEWVRSKTVVPTNSTSRVNKEL